MFRDETYLSYFGDRSPFVRAVKKCDLVMPDEARAVAKELGIAYYETSVFTYFGVNEVFENAIRAALIARRQQRFWMTNVRTRKLQIDFASFQWIFSLLRSWSGCSVRSFNSPSDRPSHSRQKSPCLPAITAKICSTCSRRSATPISSWSRGMPDSLFIGLC